jgi:hypothetical protein
MAADAAPAGEAAVAPTRRTHVKVRSWWLTYPVMTAGALAGCVGFAMSRASVAGAAPVYWLGQIALLVPCIVICIRRTASAQSRLLALQLLAALQALLAWAYSPERFRFPDELQHVRSAREILLSGHLFSANPALPVSPGFPGLEIVTTAVKQVSGLSLFAAGIITASIAHVLLVTAVFAWAHALRLGSRYAAACALVYGFAPAFPYFDALFTYSAIALPFFVLAARMAVRVVTYRESALLVLPPLFVAIVSHHLTGYLTCGFVGLVAVLVRRSRHAATAPQLARAATVGLVGAAGWTAAFAPHAYNYLLTPTRVALLALVSPNLDSAGDAAALGLPAPLWQRLIGIGGSIVMLGAAYAGARMLWRSSAAPWLRRFGWAAVAYPAVLVVRVLAADGPEISARLLLYVMLLTSIPVGYLLVSIWATGASRRRVAIALAIALLAAAGPTVSATPPSWERLPGEFHVAGYESGVDAQVSATVAYAEKAFFPGATVACDRMLCSLVAGETESTASNVATKMFYADNIVRHAEIGHLALDYVLVDDRIALQRPVTGLYFPGEGDTGPHPRPFPVDRLTAFAVDPLYSRVYDNGPIQVYDVTRVWLG